MACSLVVFEVWLFLSLAGFVVLLGFELRSPHASTETDIDGTG
jgi:hypothetical protein